MYELKYTNLSKNEAELIRKGTVSNSDSSTNNNRWLEQAKRQEDATLATAEEAIRIYLQDGQQ